eukprot:SAG11_NODE_1897_length_4085_cov_45.668587_3_plen_516_part_00
MLQRIHRGRSGRRLALNCRRELNIASREAERSLRQRRDGSGAREAAAEVQDWLDASVSSATVLAAMDAEAQQRARQEDLGTIKQELQRQHEHELFALKHSLAEESRRNHEMDQLSAEILDNLQHVLGRESLRLMSAAFHIWLSLCQAAKLRLLGHSYTGHARLGERSHEMAVGKSDRGVFTTLLEADEGESGGSALGKGSQTLINVDIIEVRRRREQHGPAASPLVHEAVVDFVPPLPARTPRAVVNLAASQYQQREIQEEMAATSPLVLRVVDAADAAGAVERRAEEQTVVGGGSLLLPARTPRAVVNLAASQYQQREMQEEMAATSPLVLRVVDAADAAGAVERRAEEQTVVGGGSLPLRAGTPRAVDDLVASQYQQREMQEEMAATSPLVLRVVDAADAADAADAVEKRAVGHEEAVATQSATEAAAEEEDVDEVEPLVAPPRASQQPREPIFINVGDGRTVAAPTGSSSAGRRLRADSALRQAAERGERARAARAAATHLQVRFRGFGGYV